MIAPLQQGAADPRLILREEELDSGLELILLAEAALWAAVDAALEAEPLGLGRSHWRAAFLLRRRPGIGVQDLSKLTSLSKQAASRTLADLTKAGLVERGGGDLDGRRKPAVLTAEGAAFEARIVRTLARAAGAGLSHRRTGRRGRHAPHPGGPCWPKTRGGSHA